MIELLILFLPLAGAVLAGMTNNRLGGQRGACAITCGFMVLASILSWVLFIGFIIDPQPAYKIEIAQWITSGTLSLNWTLRWDALSILMSMVVCTVSSVVHIYSVGYMKGDAGISRFFAYLSFFTFSMLMLVTADNLVQLFLGWEGVGLSSYLLIGFWYHKPSANAAAIKAFLVNRVGDVAFALGLVCLYLYSGHFTFDGIFSSLASISGDTIAIANFRVSLIDLTALLLFIGACGKSAQLGLHTWLPDAMEGPTPVSALIHAATMVTAGVFLVCRMSPLFEMSQLALDTMAIVGAATAFVAATIAITQTDIKRVIAYSTCSQLGYMFLAAGVSAYPAAMYHLTTHAFFKALLFLGAGSVIHVLSNTQDMHKMGALRNIIPTTFILMLIGTLAITGFPFLSGYYSKDLILESVWASGRDLHNVLWWVGIVTAGLTAFYSWRLIALVFFGKQRSDEQTLAHAHESPPIMLMPLVLLAIGAMIAGFLLHSTFDWNSYANGFWQGAIEINADLHKGLLLAHNTPTDIKIMPLLVGLLGFLAAISIYLGSGGLSRAKRISKAVAPFYKLSFNKWYFDEIYDFLLVRPTKALASFVWLKGDIGTIDRFGPNGLSALVSSGGALMGRLQSGKLYHYAFTLITAMLALIALMIFLHA